jgi:hypothetical protein
MPLRPRPWTSRRQHVWTRYARVYRSAVVEDPITHKRNRSELGRSRVWPGSEHRTGPHGEGDEPKLMMNEREKSDPAVVAVKSTNEAGQPGEEWVEPRAGAKGNGPSKARSELSVGLACHLRWVTYEGAVYSRPARHTPEVGAGCGKAARPVLCGGRIAICVPTAILISPLMEDGLP